MTAVDVIDVPLFHWINGGWASPAMDGFMYGVTMASQFAWIALVLVPIAWRHGTDLIRRFCATVIPLILLTEGVPNLLKPLFGRPRPYLTLTDVRLIVPVERLSNFGFPSNHASNAFGLALVLTALLGRRWGTLAFLVAALTAVSRVYVGVHYPLDVAAGAAIGVGLGWAVLSIFERTIQLPERRQRWVAYGGLIAAGVMVQILWRVFGQRG